MANLSTSAASCNNLGSALLILDSISEHFGWKNTSAMDTAYILFAEKYGWTPSQVRSLSPEELLAFLERMQAEMEGADKPGYSLLPQKD